MKITICGSMAFYKDLEQVRDELEELGHEVKIPELTNEAPEAFGGDKKINFGQYVEDNGGMEAFPPEHELWQLKRIAIQDHFDKIDWCDAILVTNYEKRGIAGYIGGNTLMEIGVAFYLKKPIYILNPISSELTYKQEILGMHPIMLDGDVQKTNR